MAGFISPGIPVYAGHLHWFPRLPTRQVGAKEGNHATGVWGASVSLFITCAGMVGLPDVPCVQQVASIQVRPAPWSA